MDDKEKLALLSGGPMNKTVQTVNDFPDELRFEGKPSTDFMTNEMWLRGVELVEHRYRATGSIFELGGSELRPYNYIGSF